MDTKNIMIVGVGGQGSLLASKLLGRLLLDQGYDVKVSEVHGMSQRGGSVVTYVRFGDKVYSPIIDQGEADFIVSFELLEAARYTAFLKPGGRIGNVNYLGSGDYVRIPRVEWGCGMGHKVIAGDLMPGGRRRMEKLAALLSTRRLDPGKMLTHRFNGFEHMEEALLLMKDKPRDLIKPVVVI